MAFFFGFLSYSAAVMALVGGILFGAQYALTEPAPVKAASATQAKSGPARSSTAASTKMRKVPAAQAQIPAGDIMEPTPIQQADAEAGPAKTRTRKAVAKRANKPGNPVERPSREAELALGYATQQRVSQHPSVFDIFR